MKRSLLLVIVAVLLVGSVLLGLIDTDSSIADTGIPEEDAAITNVDGDSARAGITMAMYAVDD